MASGQTRPEPMNASPHHSKVKVSLTLAGPTFVAGGHISGKMEMECRADKGLGISVMMVELFASQELTSRDHSATSMFLHSRRLFQGPGLPPSNAVQAHPLPGDPPLPQNHHQARRGVSTFLFRIPIPSSAPSSISFGGDLARVKYEVRASVGVFWKGEKRLVVNKRDIEVVESYEQDYSRQEPEAVVVGEYGKIWMQGKLVGGMAVAGESACVELQVKNHSNKKNTGLVLTMTRNLMLPPVNPAEKSRLQLSDTLTTVPFRGPEYIIPPGAEGVASLVFDVPKHARGVRGGTLEGDEAEARTSESLFEIRCIVGIRMTMGLGSKDINLELPVTIVHPLALPEIPLPGQYIPPAPYPYAAAPQAPYTPSPYAYPALPMSPPIPAFVDQHHVWLPPPMVTTPQLHQYYTPPNEEQQYYFPPPPTVPIYLPSRPLSAGPPGEAHVHYHATGLPPPVPRLPLGVTALHPVEAEEGKGERASRVTHHLRLSSRHRSVSPRSHRFPLPPAPPSHQPTVHLRNLPVPPQAHTEPAAHDAVVHSPRPFLSPKQSYSKDPITHNSIPKSVRVEELERMADEVMATTPDLSADIPKVAPPHAQAQAAVPEASDEPANVNKTLPKPPLPTITERRSPLPQRARVDTYFATAPEPVPVPGNTSAPVQPVPSERTPPTPTLTAVTPAKALKAGPHLHPGADLRTESGLDALERRLLAEVGTRKLDMGGGEGRRADARSAVQPIAIPASGAPHEPLNDSAISSLTLAGAGLGEGEHEHEHEPEHGLEHEPGHDSDEKTHRAGRSRSSVSVSGDEVGERRKRRKERGERGREGRSDKGAKEGRSEKSTKEGGERKAGRKREKDGEGHKARKSAAKGRVAAWLGEIDPAVPPLEDAALVSPTVVKTPLHAFAQEEIPAFEAEGVVRIVPHGFEDSGTGKSGDAPSATQDADKDKDRDKDIASAPNPRSSGFVPIGTLKRDTFQRRRPLTNETSAAEEARRVADIWSAPVVKDRSPKLPVMATPTHAYQSIRTDRRVSPPSSAQPDGDMLGLLGRNPWQTVRGEQKLQQKQDPAPKPAPAPLLPLPKKIAHPAPRLAVFPPPARVDPEVKYDIRSARGGRGGKVTAVASIWASGALGGGNNNSNGSNRTEPKPKPQNREPATNANANTRKTPEPVSTPKPTRAPIKPLLHLQGGLGSGGGTDPKPKLVDLAPGARRSARPVAKSSSVPALLSSSHATPMLSTTASLARPPLPHRDRERDRRAGVGVPATIVESQSEGGAGKGVGHAVGGKMGTAKPTNGGGGGELAFGQARLRDLIRKYQGA